MIRPPSYRANASHYRSPSFNILICICIAAGVALLVVASRWNAQKKPIYAECEVGTGRLVIGGGGVKFIRDGVTRHGELALFGIADELKVESTHEIPPETGGIVYATSFVVLAKDSIPFATLSIAPDGSPQLRAVDGREWVGEPALRACAILWLVALSESERSWLKLK